MDYLYVINILTFATYLKKKLMKSKAISLLIGLITIIFLTGLFFFMKFNYQQKFAIIDKERLFSEFKMTKEISNQINVSNNKLKVKYEGLVQTYNSAKNEYERIDLRQQLEATQNEIENLNGSYRVQQTELIWKRIQSYSESYSEAENYTFIFGFENNGDVIGFKKENDITENLLQYLNKRYEGIN